MRLTSWLLVASTLTGGASAHAQGPWSGGLYGGYGTGLDNGDFTHGSFALAGDVYYQVRRTLGLGAEVGYERHESRSEVIFDGSTLKYQRSAWHLAAMARLQAPKGNVRPYAALGLGLYGLRQDGDDFLAPGLNVGGGLEVHPNGRPLGIGLGARLHIAGVPEEEGILGAGFLILGLGIVYR
jgi:outer membrane protein with beta-barrel domain